MTLFSTQHDFVNPSAFAQDAVHPFEAVLQGPAGHHLAGVFYPLHPIHHAILGFLTSIYAVAAHDGRALDLNSHCKHHHYGQVRPASTRIQGNRIRALQCFFLPR